MFNVECRMCGYEFDPNEVKDDCDESSCCGCEECNYVVCPNCGYSNSLDYDVEEFKFIVDIKRLIKEKLKA